MDLPLGGIQLLLDGIAQLLHEGDLHHQGLADLHNLWNGLVIHIFGILREPIGHDALRFDQSVEDAIALAGRLPVERLVRHVQLGGCGLALAARRFVGLFGRQRSRGPGAGSLPALLPTVHQLLALLGINDRAALLIQRVVVRGPQADGIRRVGLGAGLEDLLGPLGLLDGGVEELAERPPVQGRRGQLGLVRRSPGRLVRAELGQRRRSGGVGYRQRRGGGRQVDAGGLCNAGRLFVAICMYGIFVIIRHLHGLHFGSQCVFSPIIITTGGIFGFFLVVGGGTFVIFLFRNRNWIGGRFGFDVVCDGRSLFRHRICGVFLAHCAVGNEYMQCIAY
mmetsp:Transcript_21935/g.62912  ORF Transcript_21935/g.62912 Transcript_21935/m.62912 type:complete len:336 (+) Transcript_21935:1054-2061(+)